jgi:hypothetical protein
MRRIPKFLEKPVDSWAEIIPGTLIFGHGVGRVESLKMEPDGRVTITLNNGALPFTVHPSNPLSIAIPNPKYHRITERLREKGFNPV